MTEEKNGKSGSTQSAQRRAGRCCSGVGRCRLDPDTKAHIRAASASVIAGRLGFMPVQCTVGLVMRLPIITAIVAAMALAAPRQAPDRSSAPPNIVFILADDLGYGELGSYGQRRIRTPRLDRMAAEGMRFTQFYAGSTVCAPSRGTLLTGLHTGHAHVRDNHELGGFLDEEERGQLPLPAGHPTVARWLRDRGYATAAVGKWGLGGPDSTGVPTKQGFDFFLGYLDQKQAHNYYPTHLWRNEERLPLRNKYFSPHQQLVGSPNDAAAY